MKQFSHFKYYKYVRFHGKRELDCQWDQLVHQLALKQGNDPRVLEGGGLKTTRVLKVEGSRGSEEEGHKDAIPLPLMKEEGDTSQDMGVASGN